MPEYPLFSAAALEILNGLPFDPTATPLYEVMSGGLYWRDEFPAFGSDVGRTVWENLAMRFLLAHRADFITNADAPRFPDVWAQVEQHAPNWPGLRPNRRAAHLASHLAQGVQEMRNGFEASDAEFRNRRQQPSE